MNQWRSHCSLHGHKNVWNSSLKGSLINGIGQPTSSNTRSRIGEKMQWISIQRPVHSSKHSAFTPSENSLANNNNCWIVSCIAQKVFFCHLLHSLKPPKSVSNKKRLYRMPREFLHLFSFFTHKKYRRSYRIRFRTWFHLFL